MRLRPTRITCAAVLVCALVALTDEVRGQESVPRDKAWIQVKLPADAVLVFGKSATDAKGADRLFESPSIAPGKEYTYELTATWTVDGKQKKETRTVPVKAGSKVVVDFNTPAVAPKDKDATPPKDKDKTPPKDKDTPAKDKDKDKTPPKDKDVAPPKDKDKTPPKDKDVAPPKDKAPPPKDAPAPKDKDKAPLPKDKDAAPPKDKAPPPKDKDAAPPKDKVPPPKDAAPPKDKPPVKGGVRLLDPMRPARARTFEFTYAGTLTARPGEKVRVWLPVPPSNHEQDATIISQRLPGKEEINKDPVYGNRILSFEATADKTGIVPFQVVYKITRKEVVGVVLKELLESPDLLARFL